jgi:hypothetical protein
MMFGLVNSATVGPKSSYALCGEPIGETYLREIATRASYCSHKCNLDHWSLWLLESHLTLSIRLARNRSCLKIALSQTGSIHLNCPRRATASNCAIDATSSPLVARAPTR